MYGINTCRRPWRLLALAPFALMATAAHAQLSGAIYTTLPDGKTVNGNIYPDKESVYLNGGPQNQNAAGLKDGIYFFQVTNPNGHVLLSTTKAWDRLVLVDGGRFQGRCNQAGTLLGNPVSPHKNGTKNDDNQGVPVQLMPFLDTPNHGGEYKAWVMVYKFEGSSDELALPAGDGIHVNFLHRYAKTDNFKIKEKVNPPQGVLAGLKFFDLNMNGVKDLGELPIEGFVIKIILNGGAPVYVKTDKDGNWSYGPIDGGTKYKVSEVLPQDDPDDQYESNAGTKWIQTSPGTLNDATDDRDYEGVVNVAKQGDIIDGLDFGNTQIIKLSGIKFYDRNMNKIKDTDEELLKDWPIKVKVTYPDMVKVPASPYEETLLTKSDGSYTVEGLVMDSLGTKGVAVGSKYEISEIKSGNWYQTAPPGNLHSDTIDLAVAEGSTYTTVEFEQPDITGLDFGNIQRAKLKGCKWYDTNANKVKDAGEPGIQGFKIVITYTKPNGVSGTQTIYTDANGNWVSMLFPEGTTYTVKEVLPPTGNWKQTYPAAPGTYSGTITGSGTPADPTYVVADVTGLKFGNRVCPIINAHTKGYWHNNNGYATMNDGGTIVPELTMLNALPLVRLNGSAADFNIVTPSAGFTDFSNWITYDSNGSNMACQLSAQLAAMKLNVEAGFVSGSQLLYAPGTNSANSLGIATLDDLMNEAIAALIANPVTVVSSSARTKQNAIMTALDKGNNNLNWLNLPIIIVVSPY